MVRLSLAPPAKGAGPCRLGRAHLLDVLVHIALEEDGDKVVGGERRSQKEQRQQNSKNVLQPHLSHVPDIQKLACPAPVAIGPKSKAPPAKAKGMARSEAQPLLSILDAGGKGPTLSQLSSLGHGGIDAAGRLFLGVLFYFSRDGPFRVAKLHRRGPHDRRKMGRGLSNF